MTATYRSAINFFKVETTFWQIVNRKKQTNLKNENKKIKIKSSQSIDTNERLYERVHQRNKTANKNRKINNKKNLFKLLKHRILQMATRS